jgi:hypothetical protein
MKTTPNPSIERPRGRAVQQTVEAAGNGLDLRAVVSSSKPYPTRHWSRLRLRCASSQRLTAGVRRLKR